MAKPRRKSAPRRAPEPAPVSIVPAPVVSVPEPEAQIVYRAPGRLFEWMTSGMMIGVSIILAVNPKSIQFGGFYLIENIGLTAPVLAFVFFLVGVLRIVALFLNGPWRYGPMLRAGGAVVGATIWAQMLYALTLWSMKGGYLSIGVAVYLFLAVGEAISCYRAAADGGCKSNR